MVIEEGPSGKKVLGSNPYSQNFDKPAKIPPVVYLHSHGQSKETPKKEEILALLGWRIQLSEYLLEALVIIDDGTGLAANLEGTDYPDHGDTSGNIPYE